MAGYVSVIVHDELMNDGVVMLAAAENRGDASDEYVRDGFRIPIQQYPVPPGTLILNAWSRCAVVTVVE